MSRKPPRSKKPSDRIPAREYREQRFQELEHRVKRILAGEEQIEDYELEAYLEEVKQRGTYPDGLAVLEHMYGGRARLQMLAAGKTSICEEYVWWSARAADVHEAAGRLTAAAECYANAGMHLEAARCHDAVGEPQQAERCRDHAKRLNRKKPGWF